MRKSKKDLEKRANILYGVGIPILLALEIVACSRFSKVEETKRVTRSGRVFQTDYDKRNENARVFFETKKGNIYYIGTRNNRLAKEWSETCPGENITVTGELGTKGREKGMLPIYWIEDREEVCR